MATLAPPMLKLLRLEGKRKLLQVLLTGGAGPKKQDAVKGGKGDWKSKGKGKGKGEVGEEWDRGGMKRTYQQ